MRILKHLGVISVLLSLCISCAEDILPIAVEGLELNLTTISMKVGESKTLTVTITPADAENQTYPDERFYAKLFYVLCTRPLHRLSLCCVGEPAAHLENADVEVIS